MSSILSSLLVAALVLAWVCLAPAGSLFHDLRFHVAGVALLYPAALISWHRDSLILESLDRTTTAARWLLPAAEPIVLISWYLLWVTGLSLAVRVALVLFMVSSGACLAVVGHWFHEHGLMYFLSSSTKHTLTKRSLLEWFEDRSFIVKLNQYRPLMLKLSDDEMKHYLSVVPASLRDQLLKPGLIHQLPAPIQRLLLSREGWDLLNKTGRVGAANALPSSSSNSDGRTRALLLDSNPTSKRAGGDKTSATLRRGRPMAARMSRSRPSSRSRSPQRTNRGGARDGGSAGAGAGGGHGGGSGRPVQRAGATAAASGSAKSSTSNSATNSRAPSLPAPLPALPLSRSANSGQSLWEDTLTRDIVAARVLRYVGKLLLNFNPTATRGFALASVSALLFHLATSRGARAYSLRAVKHGSTLAMLVAAGASSGLALAQFAAPTLLDLSSRKTGGGNPKIGRGGAGTGTATATAAASSRPGLASVPVRGNNTSVPAQGAMALLYRLAQNKKFRQALTTGGPMLLLAALFYLMRLRIRVYSRMRQ